MFEYFKPDIFNSVIKQTVVNCNISTRYETYNNSYNYQRNWKPDNSIFKKLYQLHTSLY